MKKVTFSIKGMTCAACVGHVERAVRAVVPDIPFTVSLLSGTLLLTLQDDTDARALFKKLQKALERAGYGLSTENAEDVQEKEKKRSLRRLILSAILSAVLMLVAMWHMIPFLPKIAFFSGHAFPTLFFLLQAILAFAVIFIERHFLTNGFSALFHGAPNMDSLVALGSTASALYGLFAGGCIFAGEILGNTQLVDTYLHELYLESAAMILTLVSVGKYLEGKARYRAAGAVRALMATEPIFARVKRGNDFERIPLSELLVGDTVLVPHGEQIPADGVISRGIGSIEESMLTGESVPRTAEVGDTVFGGTLLTEGTIEVEIRHVGDETALRRIAALLEETAATKAPAQRLADRVSAVFVPTVIGISLLTAAVWLIAAKEATLAFRAAVSVLVISCPCALGLATPTAIAVGSGRGARFGILFKSAEALETLAGVKYLLTDKTGTLTEGKMALTDLEIPDAARAEEIKTILATAEAHSTHPLARPLAALTDARCEIRDLKILAGKGLVARMADGTPLYVGNRRLFQNWDGDSKKTTAEPQETSEKDDRRQGSTQNCACTKNTCDQVAATDTAESLSSSVSSTFPAPLALPDALSARIARLEREGKSVVILSVGKEFSALAALSDTPRPDSAAAVARLEKMGIETVMLTGDHEAAARTVARDVGIETVRAGLLPEEKTAVVSEYVGKGLTAMVGDGINDAPALARADVGLAIGAGTGVAVESAGVVLSGSRLTEAVTAIELGRATKRNIRENLFWALFYNAVCIPVAAGVFYPAFGLLLTPMIASGAMSLSSLFVVSNALRLSRFRPSSEPHRSKENQPIPRPAPTDQKETKEPVKIIKTEKEEKEKTAMFGKKAEPTVITLKVNGMMCAHCTAHVEKALLALGGVTDAKADLESGTVTVTVKNGKPARDDLAAAITAQGYTVES